jgi:hypothetical protein
MRTTTDLATKKEDVADDNNTKRNQNSPSKRRAPVTRSLMAANSGTLHGMRTSIDLATKKQKEAVAVAVAETEAEAEAEDVVDNNTERNQNSPPKRQAPVVRRSLMAAKSGTLHGMQKKISKPEEISNIQREHSNSNSNGNLSYSSNSSNNKKEIERKKKEKTSVVYKNGKKTIIRQPPSISRSSMHSVAENDFLDDIVSSDDDTNTGSDVSISTCGSINDDNPLIQQMDPIPKIITASLVASSSSSSKTPIKRNNSISKKNTTNISSPSAKKKISSKISSGSGISPSSTSSQPKDKSCVKKKKKKSEDLENKKDNGISVPSSSSETKKKTKSLLSETKSNLRSINIRQQERELMESPDEYLPGLDPSTKAHKITKKEKPKNARASDISDSRPDDWIGSEKTKRRSWKVKTKEKLDVSGDNS